MSRLAGALVALGLVACGAAPAVDLAGTWPEQPDDYRDVTEAWTRTATDRAELSMVIEVVATLKSPAWRAAYVGFRSEREALSAAARAELEAAERAADAAAYEVELLVATYDPRANDLAKGERSIWRVSLSGDDGSTIAATEIVRDRRPRSEIKAFFPALGEFHEPYIARFPRGAALLGDAARTVTLRVTSAQGKVALVWRDR